MIVGKSTNLRINMNTAYSRALVCSEKIIVLVVAVHGCFAYGERANTFWLFHHSIDPSRFVISNSRVALTPPTNKYTSNTL